MTARRLGSTRALLAVIFLAALLIRIWAALQRPMLELDEAVYARMAENLAAGAGPLGLMEVPREIGRVFFSPLLPLGIAGLAAVLRDYVLSGYIMVVLFGSLLVIPTFLLGREFAGRRTGLMAAALMAVLPVLVNYSSRVYNESVYIFFLLFGIYFGWRLLHDRRPLCGLLAGVALGFAYLTNPSVVYYVAVLVALAVIVALRRGGWGSMVRGAGVLAAAFFVIAAPYLVFIHGELGKWSFTGKDVTPAVHYYSATHNLRYNTVEWEKDLYGLTDDGQEVRILRLDQLQGPSPGLVSRVMSYMSIFINQSQIFYTSQLDQVMPLWLLPLLGLGLFASGWDRRRALGVGFLALMMGPALVIMAMYTHIRFFLPFVPLALIWVAQGWQRLERWGDDTVTYAFSPGKQALWRKAVPWAIGAALLLPVLAMAAVTVRHESYPTEYREAGERLRQEAGTGLRVASRDTSSAYYAGGVAIILPYADYQRTTEYARNKNVDYLIMAKWDIDASRPDLAVLEEGPARHPDWELVDRIRPGTPRETLIFRLKR